ncbi:MAG: hotdog fold thioesterase [Alphaproteobacteria bacterium]|nr:hotdog fold thioesterase [Alphaproteobacteria bacterium]
MDAAQLNAFYAEAFPGGSARVEHADGVTARLRLPFNPNSTRPGDTVSGPTMMGLADSAMYALTLSAIGLEPMAVTTSLTMNFLRMPGRADLVAEARMLKLGRTLAVGDVTIRAEGALQPCAHAVVTYSIPPKKAVAS